MSNDLWEAGKDVRDEMLRLIANHHPTLALVDTEIAIIFRGKAAKKGGQVMLGASKKAPPILNAFTKNNYKFILEIASTEWQALSNEQRTALLDHLLCACRVEEDANSGDIKCSVAPPDVQFYWDELSRHGDWRPRPQQEAGASMDIEEMIGGKESSKPTKKGKATKGEE